MSEGRFLIRNPDLRDSQDYAFLRAEGLRHIERLGHERWTDCNVHDPGIALHELFSYALTDLGLRTGYDIRDLLTVAINGVPVNRGDFYKADEILPCNPVSFIDLRKLLIDIAGVRNAWISANKEVVYWLDRAAAALSDSGGGGREQLAPLNGLFDVFLEFEEFVVEKPHEARVGPKAKPAAGGDFITAGNRGIVFNVESELTIESVAVYGEAAADLVVRLLDRDDRQVAEKAFTLGAAGRRTLTLGFRVPPGEGYRLLAGGSARLHRLLPAEQAEAFPHALDHLVYLTGGFGGGQTRPDYYYFYDWRISYAVPPVAGLRPLTRVVTVGVPAPDVSAPYADAVGAAIDFTAARRMHLAALTADAKGAGALTLELQPTSPAAAPTAYACDLEPGSNRLTPEGFELHGGVTYSLRVTAASTHLRRSPAAAHPVQLDNVVGPPAGAAPPAAIFLHALQLEFPAQPHPVTITRGDVLTAARQRLHTRRNLCEDFIDVCDLKIEEVAVCADIEVAPGADIDEVMAEAFYRLGLHVSPAVRFYALEEMFTKGLPMEEIFEGPLLDHGFIDDEEFRAIQRRCEIRTSDVVQILMDVDGVVAIKSISLLRFIEGQDPVQEDWLLPLTPDEGRAPKFSPERSKMVFYRNGLPLFARRERSGKLLKDKKAADLQSKLRGYNSDVPVPVGTPRDVERYWPAQNELPINFLVGQLRVPRSAPALRKAQAHQLKAYLLLFEQLLANYLSQLAHLPQLFSWKDTGEPTYFTQPVVDFADHRDVYNLDGITRTLTAAGKTVPAQPDLDTELDRALGCLIETPEVRVDRRNRLLDHLIARFCEDLGPYGELLEGMLGHRAPERLIEHKRAFLGDYPALSANRGAAHDYRRPPSADNVAGYMKRIQRLLGIDEIRAHLAGRRVAIEQTAVDGPWRFVIKEKEDGSGANLFESMTCDQRSAIEALLDAVIEYGAESGNYAGMELRWQCPDDPAPTVLGMVKAPGTVDQVAGYFAAIRAAEGLHIVEHVLLRKRTRNDRFMAVQLNPPGDCECVEVIDPYSFRLSVLLPSWPDRFRDPRFRRFVEDTLRAEAPAHVFLKVCWISHDQMKELEVRLDDFWAALAGIAPTLAVCRAGSPGRSLAGVPVLPATSAADGPYRNSLDRLIDMLEDLDNVYPLATLHSCAEAAAREDKPPVTLNNTSLGTF